MKSILCALMLAGSLWGQSSGYIGDPPCTSGISSMSWMPNGDILLTALDPVPYGEPHGKCEMVHRYEWTHGKGKKRVTDKLTKTQWEEVCRKLSDKADVKNCDLGSSGGN